MADTRDPVAERRGVRPVDSIYLHIGDRIRERRMTLGMSMRCLADAVGLSAPQVQKYEKGRDRLPAGHLYSFATVLGCSPAYFLEGLDGIPGAPFETSAMREVRELFKAFVGLPAEKRAAVLSLLQAAGPAEN